MKRVRHSLLSLSLALCVSQYATAIEWAHESDHRFRPLAVPSTGHAGFTLLEAATLGISFTNHLPDKEAARFQNLTIGAGLAAGDVNGDGHVDLFFCHKWGPDTLFINRGNGTFTNATPFSGIVSTNPASVGAVFADLTGNGHLDLIVSQFGGPHGCWFNDGTGRFTNSMPTAQITGQSGGTSIAVADLDGDGDLDVYFCNFGTLSPLRDGAVLSERLVNGVPTITGRHARKVRIIDNRYFEFGDPDILFWNQGGGRFKPASWESTFFDESGRPVPPPEDFGLAVQIRDINGDGHPDIYVCNDFQTPDRIWLGNGRGRFTAMSETAVRNESYASMGVDFADIDRDGHLDWITVEMLSRDRMHHLQTSSPMEPLIRRPGRNYERETFARNTLQHNQGDGRWIEIANYAGVAASDWSWSVAFIDVDLDGFEDILVSNGHARDVNDRDTLSSVTTKRPSNMRGDRSVLDRYPPLTPPKRAFRNNGDLTFEECGNLWGFDSTRIAHGMALADIDGDGDLDVILNCLEGSPLIYRNETIAPRVAIRLRGLPPNTQGIGAHLTLEGGPVTQTQEVIAGGIYLSGSDPMRVFAAGANPMTLTVRWRDGTTQVIENIRANHLYEIHQPSASHTTIAASSSPPPTLTRPTPLFTQGPALPVHRYLESPFEDFANDPLATRRYSQIAPGIAVADINADGLDDVLISPSRGGSPEVYVGDGLGGFNRHDPPFSTATLRGGGRSILALRQSGSRPDVFIGQLSVEPESTRRHPLLRWIASEDGWQSNAGHNPPSADVPLDEIFQPDVPTKEWAPSRCGLLVAADSNGDGSIELFAGGYKKNNRYTSSDTLQSHLWRTSNAGLTLGPQVDVGFDPAGFIQSAVLADLNDDGLAELVTASEWGVVHVASIHQANSSSRPLPPLPKVRGWWQSLAVADLDGDGRLDIIAGNWGLNSLWNVWGSGRPAGFATPVHAEDMDSIIEAWVDPDTGTWHSWRDRNFFEGILPAFAEQFTTHKAFSEANLESAFQSLNLQYRKILIDTLETVIFLQRDTSWEVRPLPRDAQLTPVMGIVIADFDGDGAEDIFLAQNCFAVRPEDNRLDAGTGLLLINLGDATFHALRPSHSGILVQGEQRGAATGDFNGDGRPDIVVTQNAEPARTWLNQKGKPGLHVKLDGGPGNPDAWGATVRLHFASRTGPRRALVAGSGYASQNASGALLPTPESPTSVEVVWPGGLRTHHPVPPSLTDAKSEAPRVMTITRPNP